MGSLYETILALIMTMIEKVLGSYVTDMTGIITGLVANMPDVKPLPFQIIHKALEVDFLRINSIYEVFNDEKYNPFAWIGDYFD